MEILFLLTFFTLQPLAHADTTLQNVSCFYGIPNGDSDGTSKILGEQRAIVMIGGLFTTRHVMLEPIDWCVGPYANNKQYMNCMLAHKSKGEENSKTANYFYKKYPNKFAHDRDLSGVQESASRCRSLIRKISEIAWH